MVKNNNLNRKVASRVVGYDFFISYRHVDASDYAKKLHALLENKGYIVFRDESEADNLGTSTEEFAKLARSSRCLVTIVTPNVYESESVYEELSSYLTHRIDNWYRRPFSRIISINVEQSLSKATSELPNWLKLSNFVYESETQAAIDSGIPSNSVVEKLISAGTFMNSWRRFLIGAAAIALLSLSTVAGATFYLNHLKGQISIAENKLEKKEDDFLKLTSKNNLLALQTESLKDTSKILKDEAARLSIIKDKAIKDANDAKKELSTSNIKLNLAKSNLDANKIEIANLGVDLKTKKDEVFLTEKKIKIREYQKEAAEYFQIGNHTKAKETIYKAYELEKEIKTNLNSLAKMGEFINSGMVISRNSLENTDTNISRKIVSSYLINGTKKNLIVIEDTDLPTQKKSEKIIVFDFINEKIQEFLNCSLLKSVTNNVFEIKQNDTISYLTVTKDSANISDPYSIKEKTSKPYYDITCEVPMKIFPKGMKTICNNNGDKIVGYNSEQIITYDKHTKEITKYDNLYTKPTNIYFINNYEVIIEWNYDYINLKKFGDRMNADVGIGQFNVLPEFDNVNEVCFLPDGTAKNNDDTEFKVPLYYNSTNSYVQCDDELKYLVKIYKNGIIDYCKYEFNGPAIGQSKISFFIVPMSDFKFAKNPESQIISIDIINGTKLTLDSISYIKDCKENNVSSIYIENDYAIFSYFTTGNEKKYILFSKVDEKNYKFIDNIDELKNYRLEFPILFAQIVNNKYKLYLSRGNEIWVYENHEVISKIQIPVPSGNRKLLVIDDYIFIYDQKANKIKVINSNSPLDQVDIPYTFNQISLFNSIEKSNDNRYLYITTNGKQKSIKILNPIAKNIDDYIIENIDGALKKE